MCIRHSCIILLYFFRRISENDKTFLIFRGNIQFLFNGKFL